MHIMKKQKWKYLTLGFSAGGVVRCTSSSRDMREAKAWHGMAWRKSKPRRTVTPLIAESGDYDSRKNDSFASFSTSASPAPKSSEYQVPGKFCREVMINQMHSKPPMQP